MTKPITTVALLTLIEDGKVLLSDPVSKFIPAFADAKVWKDGTADNYETVPLETPINVRHILTHTSGITYSFLGVHPVEQIIVKKRISFTDLMIADGRFNLETFLNELATVPLSFQPGTRFAYGWNNDLQARIIEVVS